MNKKLKITLIVIIILAIIGIVVYEGIYYSENEDTNNNNDETKYTENIDISHSGNSQVINTKVKSTIRVINEYDSSMFENKKSIIFMWASWCPNCATELDELQKILNYYKDSNYNVVFVAHEFEYSIQDLISLLENDYPYDTEILLDLGRVIRKHFDPEADTVPRTYFIDENCEVLGSIDHATTLDEVKNLVETYFK